MSGGLAYRYATNVQMYDGRTDRVMTSKQRTSEDGIAPSALTDAQQLLYETIRQSQRASDPRPFPITDANGELVGPFKQLLLSPGVGAALERLGGELRTPTALTERAREISILLVAAHEQSEYEWRVHAHRGVLLGLDQEMLDRLAATDITALSDESERAVAELTLHLLQPGAVDEGLLGAAESRLGPVAVFEVTVLTGYYRLLAAVTAARELSDQSNQ